MEKYNCVPNTIKHSKDFVKLFLHVFDMEKLTSMERNIVARSLSQEKAAQDRTMVHAHRSFVSHAK